MLRPTYVRLQVYREDPLGENPETIDEIWRDMVLPDDLTCEHCKEELKTYGGLLNHLAWGYLHRVETGEGQDKVIQARARSTYGYRTHASRLLCSTAATMK